MAKSDLLKEAIADAKAVKETALANAKIALQEAFAPRLERMLQTKLTNEIEGEDEEMPVAEEPVDGVDAGEEVAPEGGDDFNWTDDHLSAEVGGNEYDFTVGMGGEEDENMPAEEEPMSNDEMSADYSEEDDEDLNLEQIIRELEGDLDNEEMSDDDMMMPEGMYSEEDEMPEEDDSIDEIIEAILREEAEDDMMMDKPMEEGYDEEKEDMKQDLEEAYRTVTQLRNILSEVNLLNAKLLYTNKLFRNFELSENQKMKVIENFDRAGNTREVKLVFTTLAESFKRPVTKKRIVKESYASKPTATTAPARETTRVLNEGFEMAERWKKLAGLL
jgi:hypothetical protein